jgi:hypothetical protein
MSQHLDLDTLSAALDGEADETAVHLGACRPCRARLAELQSAREAVAQPVPPPPDAVRERAIAQALAVADEWGVASTAQPAAAPSSTPDDPPPDRRQAAVVDSPGPAATPSRWRWVAGGSAAAAVLILVVAISALVAGGSRHDSQTALSTGSVPERNGAGSAGAGSAGAGSAAGDEAVVDGGDLGDVASIDALRARVPARQRAASASNAAPAAPAPALSASPPPADAGGPVPRQVGTRVCEMEARAARPGLGVVVYAATARFQGVGAVVLGFGATPGAPPETVLVLAPQEGCRLLGETTPS